MKQRRLAAIMFTDIVGYTSLMGKDEDQAFKILHKNREIHRTMIHKYGGEWLKEMGDGILSSFQSSSDAVRCAQEIQVTSLREKILLRIGIHEGEVVFENGDVLGDGVNIASRLEASAAAGSILVSEAVYHNVRNKKDIQADFVREATFKNVDHPIRLYQVHYGDQTETDIQGNDPHQDLHPSRSSEVSPPLPDRTKIQKAKEYSPEGSTGINDNPDPAKRKQKARRLSILGMGFIILIATYFFLFKKDKFESIKDADGRISIAVMPFRNLSGDTLFNWWQAGIQNVLITELSNSKELSVRQNQTMYLALESKKTTARASVTPEVAGEIASELNAKTFILGSILKAGDKVRLNAQLINTQSGEIFKTYELDGKSEDDFFSMTDSLSVSIKNFLDIRKLVESHQSPDIIRSSIYTHSSEAFKYFIFGHEAFSKSDLNMAVDWFIKAIHVDPDFINAYIGLIFAYGILGNDDLGRKYLNIVNNKKQRLPFEYQLALEHLKAYFYGNPEEEIKYIRQILEIDEMNPTYWFLLGRAHQKLKQYPEAIECWEKTLSIYEKWGIRNPNWWIYYWLGDAYHQVNNHQREEEVYQMGLSQVPDHVNILRNQAVCALSLGNFNKAGEYLKKGLKYMRERGDSEANILSQMAIIYQKAHLLDSAEFLYRQALELEPSDPDKMNDLASLLIDSERNVKEGVELIQKALEINPDNWYYLDTWGWGLYKQGDYEEALKVLKDAWPLRPSSNLTEAYLHIQAVEKKMADQRKKN